MFRILRDLTPTLIVVVAAFLVVFALSSYLDHSRPQLPAGFNDSDLVFQGKQIKGYALGSEGMLADWYWMMSLQYLGSKLADSPEKNLDIGDLTNLNPRLLYPYLDNATDLDPSFFPAYSYGAVVLPAINADHAIALTEKGIRNNPDKWRLHQYLGYIYWHRKDYAKAAETYTAGSRVPGSPPFLKQMAAAMLNQGGSRDTARNIYTQMLNESEDEQSRRNAQLRIWQLDAEDELQVINAVLKETTTCPAALSMILPAVSSKTLPNGRDFRVDRERQLVDPSGVPYYFDKKSCSATIDGAISRVPKL